MSETLERRLRDVVGRFPRPDPAVTRSVEERLRRRVHSQRPTRQFVFVVAALVAALIGGVAVGRFTAPASAIDAATFRMVDLTMICTTKSVFGIREIDIGASPRLEVQGATLPALIAVSTGTSDPEALAGARARRDPSGNATGQIYHNRLRCSLTQAQIPIRPAGLPGPPIEYATNVDCGATRRVIVRLRGALATAGSWQRVGDRREFRAILRDVTSAAVAVRTWPGRKPLALVTLDATQATRLWHGYGCD
jgi:hypothetical protein